MLNVNVGVLGHVDSGKTSLSRALSTVGSTAAFDKSPQSHERGITLDLGFSSFSIDVTGDPRFQAHQVRTLQVTLVDCPGHASLIRTVIGGAQIVDLMVVVVDATKGIQTQTAECLVVGEVIGKPLVVALNKVDAVQGQTDADKSDALKKMRKRLEKTLSLTRWCGAPIVDVAADPGARGSTADGDATATAPVGLSELTAVIQRLIDVDGIVRTAQHSAAQSHAFLMYVDHCFPVKGQGTVLTGTVMQGRVSVGEDVTLPDYQLVRRVKSIQVFRKAVGTAQKGDRIGMCIAQFDAKDMERGIACGTHAGVVSTSALIATVNKVRYHSKPVEAAQTFHISIGHSTVMGTMRFFAAPSDGGSFTWATEYVHLDELPDASALAYAAPPAPGQPAAPLASPHTYYAIVLLDRPITTIVGATIIASHLDSDIHGSTCRLAVVGQVQVAKGVDVPPDVWRGIRAVKYKHRRVMIDRVVDPKTCIAKGIVRPKEGLDAKAAGAQMFSDVQRFVGLFVHAVRGGGGEGLKEGSSPPPTAAVGRVDSAFGKTGKVKLIFSEDVFQMPAKVQAKGRGGRGGEGNRQLATPAPAATDPQEADDEDDTPTTADGPTNGAAVGDVSGRVRLYFFSKKFPFAQHCPLQQ